jgi:hypothetical protein
VAKQLAEFPEHLPRFTKELAHRGPALALLLRIGAVLQGVSITARSTRAESTAMHATALLAVNGGGATGCALSCFGPAPGTGEHGDSVSLMCSSHHDPQLAIPVGLLLSLASVRRLPIGP